MKALKIVLLMLLVQLFCEQTLAQKIKKQNTQNSHLTKPVNKTHNNKPEKLIDRLEKELNLDETQSKQINQMIEQRAEKIEKIKLNHDHINQKIIDLNAVNADFESKLKQILSPKQFLKYEHHIKN